MYSPIAEANIKDLGKKREKDKEHDMYNISSTVYSCCGLAVKCRKRQISASLLDNCDILYTAWLVVKSPYSTSQVRTLHDKPGCVQTLLCVQQLAKVVAYRQDK